MELTYTREFFLFLFQLSFSYFLQKCISQHCALEADTVIPVRDRGISSKHFRLCKKFHICYGQYMALP